MGCPSGESHIGVMSSSCPQTQTMVEPAPCTGVARVNRGICFEENFIHTLKTTKLGEKPKFNGVTEDTAAKRTGLS